MANHLNRGRPVVLQSQHLQVNHKETTREAIDQPAPDRPSSFCSYRALFSGRHGFRAPRRDPASVDGVLGQTTQATFLFQHHHQAGKIQVTIEGSRFGFLLQRRRTPRASVYLVPFQSCACGIFSARRDMRHDATIGYTAPTPFCLLKSVFE